MYTKTKQIFSQTILKSVLMSCVCLMMQILLLPFANFEPISTMHMTIGSHCGIFASSIFLALSIFSFNWLNGILGCWTIAAIAMHLVAQRLTILLMHKPNNKFSAYVSNIILYTIIFDALTGLTVGPLFYNQPFLQAVLGQIPFTAKHILGNLILLPINLQMISFLQNILDLKTANQSTDKPSLINFFSRSQNGQ